MAGAIIIARSGEPLLASSLPPPSEPQAASNGGRSNREGRVSSDGVKRYREETMASSERYEALACRAAAPG
jgi:hypothetical protein